jgi:hypothetical protein
MQHKCVLRPLLGFTRLVSQRNSDRGFLENYKSCWKDIRMPTKLEK